MDALSAWVKQIILLVLFATFLELLIPNNGYKKFVKVIMGLLILLAILQPVLDLVHKRWADTDAAEVTAYNIVDNKGNVPISSADIQHEHERIALGQYRKELIKQIRVLAGTVDGVSDIKAEVQLNEAKGEKNYGMLMKVTVYAKAGSADKNGSASVESVKPVQIQPTPPGAQTVSELDEQKQAQIKRVVAEFYHLKTEQVAVKEWPEK